MKRLLLYTSLYKSIFVPSSVITILCANLFSTTGIAGITALCWFKLITTPVFLSYSIYNNRRSIYYFYNLNISKKSLLLAATLADLLLFTLTMMAVHYLHNPSTIAHG